VEQVPSEDPSLNAAYAMQYVRGLQEDPEHPGALKVVSTGKHYFAYDCENCRALGDPCMPDSTNSCTTDRTKFDANVSKRDLVEYYWPAWRAAAGGGKISSVMCSYNAINSVPACGNDYGMNTILRGQFNFTGAVVSDCGAVGDGAFSAYVKSKFGGDQRRQAALGVQSGCDLNCGSFYTGHVPDAVDANILPQADVDIALERIWKMNIELGLLDKPSKRNPFRDVSKYGPRQVDTPRSRALALSAAEQSMTLLKNTGSLLPLALNSTRVALIGPQFNVTTEMLSIYASESNQLVREHSPWSAFKRGGARITASVRGCNDTLGDGQSDIDCMEDSQFTAAAAAAKGADVVLLFLGIRPAAFTPKNASSGAWEGEGRDRISTGLPGLQAELLRRVTEANKHTVLILINGGMLSIENIIPDVAAILECRYPGQLGGDAIFKTVFGMNAPAGRLTTTWYPSTFTATRPITDMSLRDHGGITYMHYDKKPVFPFGFGLSYSKFEFRAVEDSVRCTTVSLAAHHLDYLATAGEEQSPCALHVQATNTGMVPSDIVILGFLRSTHADAPRNKELFGFVREVAMIPREARTVLLSVPAQVLSLVDEDGSEHLRSGRYTLEVGVEGSAEMVPTRATLEVEGADVELFKTSPQDE
jgi:beta-D-xylosidase 4